MKTLKYFVWNAIISGTLVAGHLLDWMDGTGTVIGILYVFIIECYVFMVLFSGTKTVKNALVKSGTSFRIELLVEPLWPIIAIYMGYNKIGIAMISETLMFFYLCIVTYQAKKEMPESEDKDDIFNA